MIMMNKVCDMIERESVEVSQTNRRRFPNLVLSNVMGTIEFSLEALVDKFMPFLTRIVLIQNWLFGEDN